VKGDTENFSTEVDNGWGGKRLHFLDEIQRMTAFLLLLVSKAPAKTSLRSLINIKCVKRKNKFEMPRNILRNREKKENKFEREKVR